MFKRDKNQGIVGNTHMIREAHSCFLLLAPKWFSGFGIVHGRGPGRRRRRRRNELLSLASKQES
jgi:hypothetical protein